MRLTYDGTPRHFHVLPALGRDDSLWWTFWDPVLHSNARDGPLCTGPHGTNMPRMIATRGRLPRLQYCEPALAKGIVLLVRCPFTAPRLGDAEASGVHGAALPRDEEDKRRVYRLPCLKD